MPRSNGFSAVNAIGVQWLDAMAHDRSHENRSGTREAGVECPRNRVRDSVLDS